MEDAACTGRFTTQANVIIGKGNLNYAIYSK